MSLWTSSPSTKPSGAAASPLWGRRWAWLALALLASLLLALPALAESPLETFETGADYQFSKELSFWLEAEAKAPVQEVILFYGREGTPLVRRIYPAFAPSVHTQAQHIEPLEPGQYAPGTTLRYWWRLLLASGERVDTTEQTFVYWDDAHDWQTLSEGRVDLHWYAGQRAQAQEWLQLANEALIRIEQEIGISSQQRIQVYVYANERDMRPALATRSDDYDARVTTLGVVVDEDTLVLLGSHPEIERTLAHELCHIVVGLATANPYRGLPRWLDEGLAMYAEEDLPPSNAQALAQAIRDDALLSVRSMSSYSGRAEEVDLFYGASYSVVAFLLETYGREKMQELLQVFGQGMLQEDALRLVYGFGLDELDTLWRASLGLGPRTLPGQETGQPCPMPLAELALAPASLVARVSASGWR